jgi:5'-deoxynucleotidase YfbR-like HD superfamily hydrolase
MDFATAIENIDVVVLVMKEEEFQYALNAVQPAVSLTATPGMPTIELGLLKQENGAILSVAICQTAGQGPVVAAEVSQLIATKLSPRWLLICGVCGATAKEPTVTLGDVLVANHVYGPLNRAELPESLLQSSDPIGGQLRAETETLAGALRRRLRLNPDLLSAQLASWGVKRPQLKQRQAKFCISAHKSISAINLNLSHNAKRKHPQAFYCAFISDAILRKDPVALDRELQTRRDVVGIEMELGGAVGGLRRHPEIIVTKIRGVSDLVGLERDEAWTKYAAGSAAAALSVVLHDGIIEPRVKSPEFLSKIAQYPAKPPLDRKTPSVSGTHNAGRSEEEGELEGASVSRSRPVSLGSSQATKLFMAAWHALKGDVEINIERLTGVSESLNIYWLDEFSARLIVAAAIEEKQPQLSRVIGDHLRKKLGEQIQSQREPREVAMAMVVGAPVPATLRHLEPYLSEHEWVRDYLVAQELAHSYAYLAHAADRSKEDKKKRQKIMQYVGRIYNFRTNQMLKEIISIKKKQDQSFEQKVARGIESLLSDPTFPLGDRAHAYYVAGRIRDDKIRRRLLEILSGERKKIDDYVKLAPDSLDNLIMMRRSLYVSLGYMGDTISLCVYIGSLLKDFVQDEHNRGFHLDYFGDQPIWVTDSRSSKDMLEDFSRTRRTLMTRLREAKNPLLLLEAQTLASLAQKRHEVGKLPSRKLRESISAALTGIVKKHPPIPSENYLLEYLEMIAADLLVDDFRPEMFFNELNNVRHTPRTGWLERNAPKVETVGAHSFGAMSLAIDFLPERYLPELSADIYDKDKIVLMLLYHDRPEGKTGDIPSPRRGASHDAVELKIARQLELMETYDFDRSGRAYGQFGHSRGNALAKEFAGEQTLNAKIAREIDRIDAIYEALRLITAHALANRSDYFQMIRDLRNLVQTPLGNYVLDRVIRMDPAFSGVLESALA